MPLDLLVKFTLTSLAVFRLARLISIEDGPFDVFREMRARMVKWTVERGREHWIVNGFHCVHCVGFWIALVFTLPLYLWAIGTPTWTNTVECVILWQSLSGMTFVWKRIID